LVVAVCFPVDASIECKLLLQPTNQKCTNNDKTKYKQPNDKDDAMATAVVIPMSKTSSVMTIIATTIPIMTITSITTTTPLG